MKKGLILVLLVTVLLGGCGVKEKSDRLVLVETPITTNTTSTTTKVQETSQLTTKRVTAKTNNLYTEVESHKKEKHKYTFVYKTFDECYKSGEELLPLLKQIRSEIVGMDCMYLKDNKNKRVWGVLFKTCDDPTAVCNFYY